MGSITVPSAMAMSMLWSAVFLLSFHAPVQGAFVSLRQPRTEIVKPGPMLGSFSRILPTPAPSTSAMSMASSSKSGGGNNEEPTLWSLTNDFPLFLNQCAIQSFMFLLRSLRDPQTVLWLEEFTQPVIRSKRAIIQQAIDKNKSATPSSSADTDIGSSHQSTTTSSSPNTNEMPAPPLSSDTTPNSGVNARSLLYHGLGLLNTTLFPTWDSYFRQLLEQPTTTFVIESSRPHIPNYELQINPASLCSRLLSVREQIAQEFANDLTVIASLSQQSLDAYWQAVKGEEKGGDAYSPNIKGLRPSLGFLDYTSGEEDDENDFAPSPLRKGNFDLLVLLTTQEAIHRVLNSQARSESNSNDNTADRFLYNFYTERLVTHFTGIQPYGRADDFVEELLTTPPRLMQISETLTSLIDPVRIVELILQEREQVALEWKQVAKSSPQMHMEIKRLQLNRLMGRTGEEEMNSYQ